MSLPWGEHKTLSSYDSDTFLYNTQVSLFFPEVQTFVQRIVVKRDFFSSTCKETFFHGYFAQNISLKFPLKTLGLRRSLFLEPKGYIDQAQFRI